MFDGNTIEGWLGQDEEIVDVLATCKYLCFFMKIVLFFHY